jgi:hypothetical protein
MSVDISDILHVLAHELRTPVGIAHGYVRLLLEERLHQESDRRRALEQMQKALGRLSDLSHESSRLATWFEQDGQPLDHVAAASVVAQLADAQYDAPVAFAVGVLPDRATIRTCDVARLVSALITMVRATARELRGAECTVSARLADQRFLDVLIGPHDRIGALDAGRGSTEAGPLALERGGLGLSLVEAAVVLDAHGVERWTIDQARQTAGLRIPLAERSHT